MDRLVIRRVGVDDAGAWLRMREALWPDETGSHAKEIQDYLAGRLNMPLEVLLAVDDADALLDNDVSASAHHALGFEETVRSAVSRRRCS